MTKHALMLAACAIACGCSAAPPERTPMTTATPQRRDAPPGAEARTLAIDLLYLDLTSCGRCVGTDRSLEAGIADVSSVLGATGVKVALRKVHVDTADLAREHRFLSSPTIRVDGRDVALELRESSCEDCAEICGRGGGVDCRVWVWQGQEHTVPPKAMVVDALLRAVYAPQPGPAQARPYELPENLRRFFESTTSAPKAPKAASTPCCAEPATCCTAEAKPETASAPCCAEPESCCSSAGSTTIEPRAPRR